MAIQSLPTTTVHQSHQPLALPTYPPIYTSSQIFFTSDNVEQKHYLIGFSHWVLVKSLRWNGKWQYKVYLPPQSTSHTNLWLYLPTHQFTPAHSSSSLQITSDRNIISLKSSALLRVYLKQGYAERSISSFKVSGNPLWSEEVCVCYIDTFTAKQSKSSLRVALKKITELFGIFFFFKITENFGWF